MSRCVLSTSRIKACSRCVSSDTVRYQIVAAMSPERAISAKSGARRIKRSVRRDGNRAGLKGWRGALFGGAEEGLVMGCLWMPRVYRLTNIL